MNQSNPWDRASLEAYIGREESAVFEVKSSRDLVEGDKGRTDAFFKNHVGKAVSALLNSEGGLFVIGMEEGRHGSKETVTELSAGVPRSVLNRKLVEDRVFGLINPSVANLVQVHSVDLDVGGDDPRLAFVIDVRRGNTAYQSASDKVYYVRRGASSVGMDDKDVRLRMLSDDKPRVGLALALSADDAIASIQRDQHRRIEDRQRFIAERDEYFRSNNIPENERTKAAVWASDIDIPDAMFPSANRPPQSWQVAVLLTLMNVGFVTIREFAVQTSVSTNDYTREMVRGLPESLDGALRHWVIAPGDGDELPLFPDGQRLLRYPSLTVMRDIDLEKTELGIRSKVFLDNGRAHETFVDATDQLKTCILSILQVEQSAFA